MEEKKYLVGKQSEVWKSEESQQITFIVTADCNLRCKYCYITHKDASVVMDFEVAKKFIDYLLDNESMKKQEAIVLDFIGGEPLLEVDLIDKICDYFKVETFKRNSSWYWNYRINTCTNGVNYSNDKVQAFIKKNYGKIYVSITLDGTKEKHDMQRVFPDGSGSYDIVRNNVNLWLKQFSGSTKVTFASDDLPLLKESIIQLWKDGIKDISANVVFEDVWKESDDKIFEEQLVMLADYIIDNDLYNAFRCTFFNDTIGGAYTEDDMTNTSCGAGKMLAVGPNGNIYPCMRYYDYSLNKKDGLVIGDIDSGIDFDRVRPFETVMYKYQSDQECLNCEVATGCAFCQGFNYDEADTKTNFQRAKYICEMHKARVRANNYYFAMLYNVKDIKREYNIVSKKSLIFLLDSQYTTFCSYSNKIKKKKQIMDIESIKKGLEFAKKTFRKPIFIHSDDISVIDKLNDELIGHEILHILPSNCKHNLQGIKDYILVVDEECMKNEVELHGKENIVFNIESKQLKHLPIYIETLFKKVDRININITRLNKDFDLKEYDEILSQIDDIIISYASNKIFKEVNILTDLLFLNEYGCCKAGEDIITYAPNQKFYICPAFYTEELEAIGSIKDGLNIKNEHLLTNKYAPLCNSCDAYQCENCKFINQTFTGEINVSPGFQCKKAHIERKHSLFIQTKLGGDMEMKRKIKEIDYDDPYKALLISCKELGFYNC